MIPLPSKHDMEILSKEVRCAKILSKDYEENKEEFRKGLESLLTTGWEMYRIMPDGKVKFITEQEYKVLWQDQK